MGSSAVSGWFSLHFVSALEIDVLQYGQLFAHGGEGCEGEGRGRCRGLAGGRLSPW